MQTLIKKAQLINAKEFLKFSKKFHKEFTKFHKLYKLDNTYQLCDGFTVIVLKDMIEGLELNQDKTEYLDGRKIIDMCKTKLSDYEQIHIDISQLEEQANVAKKLECVTFQYTVHFKESYYNPIYLLRAIRILGTENVTIYIHNSSYKDPAYLKSDLGEALVLPIVPPKELRKY